MCGCRVSGEVACHASARRLKQLDSRRLLWMEITRKDGFATRDVAAVSREPLLLSDGADPLCPSPIKGASPGSGQGDSLSARPLTAFPVKPVLSTP